MPQTITFSVNQNRHPDCELPGICPFCANSTWCENSSEHGKVSVKFLRWLCGFVVLVILAMATCAKANAGTISGNIQTATGAGVTNGTLGFTLSQSAVLSGTATLVTQTSSCYTSTGGAVVGLPDPLVLPSTSTNTASGTLPSGTYYVQLWYVNGSSHSLAGPEQVVVLGALGTVNVNAPGFQPSAASGYAVAIGSTSGGETLQGTVTGWTQYQQSTPLVTGTAIPSSNNSACQLAFSDTLVPTGTFYTVSLMNQNGSPVAGFPQTWCTYGGLTGTINVSNGAPNGNCSTAGVFYPTPLFSTSPTGAGTQSLTGNFNVGGNESVGGSLTVGGPTTFNTLIGLHHVVYVDGITYPRTSAGINSAVAAACNGTIPGKVVLSPTGTGQIVTGFSAQITMPSFCTLEGPGRANLVLQSTGNFNLINISGKTNVYLKGFGVDGGRTNAADLIVVQNSTFVEGSDLGICNALGNGLGIYAGTSDTSNLKFDDIEVCKNGPALPGQATGVWINPNGANNIRHVQFSRCLIHDNNLGFTIANPTGASNVVEDVSFNQCQFYSNANDGFNANSNGNLTGGLITATRIVNSESYCNGWPANGTGFSAKCTAGLLQTGASGSSSGVGFDFIGPQVTHSILVGNRAHDNFIDGFSQDAHVSATVSTANSGGNTTLTETAGASFNTNWRANQWVLVNAVAVQVVSVASTTSMVVTTNFGTHTGYAFVGPAPSYNTLTGNQSYSNGGTGFFYYYSDFNTFSANIARLNALEGIGIWGSYENTSNADKSFSNNTSNGTNNAGFLVGFDLDAGLFNISTEDTSGLQANGVLVESSTNTLIKSNFIVASVNVVADTASSTGTHFDNGQTLGTPINLSGQVANLAATTIFTTNASTSGLWSAGLYQVCVTLWPTVTGNTTALQANAVAPSGAGTVVLPIGTALNTAALTNGGGGCTVIHAPASSAIQVSVTGYNTTGTYSIQATVQPQPLI